MLEGHAVDALVIGGGFYGVAIAVYLAERRGIKKVCLIEREGELLSRASYVNQARIHNGYHYPRSFTTAYRSRINAPRFLREWPDASKVDFAPVYAIARRNSKVTSRQFQRFCKEIGADLRPARPELDKLFNPMLIEAVFEADEYAFDASVLRRWSENALREANVEVHKSHTVISVTEKSACKRKSVVVSDKYGDCSEISAKLVFNCTYSGLNHVGGEFTASMSPLKHEISEMALIKLPSSLARVGITVMDGPFFSVMPFPSRGLHTLSHVRYTPHFSWQDTPDTDPYRVLADYEKCTRFDRMIRDVKRYVPSMGEATQIDSLFEVKSVLVKNEGDDGRPILFEKQPEMHGCYSVLGGKIDNIYDVLEKLESEDFSNAGTTHEQ